MTLPVPPGRACELGLANQGIPSPWTCNWFRARPGPQGRPADSAQGLAETAGKVPTPLPLELLADLRQKLQR